MGNLGQDIPVVIQNRNLTSYMPDIPEINQTAYLFQFRNRVINMRQEDNDAGCYLGDKFDTILVDMLVERHFPDVLPKLDRPHKMKARDAIVWQGTGYRPVSWIRQQKKWIPVEFMDMERSDGRDLSEQFLVGCKEFMDKVGRLLDSFEFAPYVILRHRPTGLVVY